MFRTKIVMLAALLLAACAPVTATPSPIVTEEPTPGSVAVVKSIDIQILESFPLQVHAVVRGDLPDAGCTTIASVEQVREGNTFTLTLVTTTDPLALCAQALTPFEEVVALDVQGLPAGIYTVDVHGVQQTFEFTVDNSLQEQPIDTDVYPTDVEYVLAQQDLPIHSGVGGSPTIVGQVFAGQVAKVTGTNFDGTWWQIVCPDGVGSCWVSADPAMTQPTQPPQ
ncbi:MAG TPA: hypothetical protein VK888_09710 [Anaerolineales bacterium]|nr:hypothetical protein [Anaerolineales bacterium]